MNAQRSMGIVGEPRREADLQATTPRLFFIVGRGRSGTTLLSAILNAHPQLTIAPESLFLLNLHAKYSHGSWTVERGEAFFRDLWLERRMEDWDLNKEALRIRILDAVERGATFATLCELVYREYARVRGKPASRWVGDKNPHYALFIPMLRSLYPHAPFIHLTRDYRDNILSYQNVRFDLHGSAALAYRWVQYNQAILDALSDSAVRSMRLRFEDLVTHPETTLTRLCAFLGVEFDTAMLRYHEHVSHSRPVWHRNLGTPLDSGRVDTWVDKMAPRDQAVASTICGAVGAQLGYPACEQPGTRLSVGDRLGVGLASLMTLAERVMFVLPLRVRSALVTTFRRFTGSLPSREPPMT